MLIYILRQIDPDNGVQVFPYTTMEGAEEMMHFLYEEKKKWSLRSCGGYKKDRSRIDNTFAVLTCGYDTEFRWLIDAETMNKVPGCIYMEDVDKIDNNNDEEIPGYAVCDFDGTGILEIRLVPGSDIFENLEEAVRHAIMNGIKLIPVDELPSEFAKEHPGCLDTPENRKKIEDYCKNLQ